MVDCGYSVRETVRRLGRLARQPSQISAILVTHEHSDHISGVARFASKHAIPVYGTWGTLTQSGLTENPRVTTRVTDGHTPFVVGDIQVMPVAVPHDAREPCQFMFEHNGLRLGILTDLGSVTPHVVRQYSGCDALLLEANHDPLMLANGPYPLSLKHRVGGDYGHLSNQQAATLLEALDCSRLQHLVACHISEKNNRIDTVRNLLAAALNRQSDWITVACQQQGLPWRQILQN